MLLAVQEVQPQERLMTTVVQLLYAQAPVFRPCDSSQKFVHRNAERKRQRGRKQHTEVKMDRRCQDWTRSRLARDRQQWRKLGRKVTSEPHQLVQKQAGKLGRTFSC